MSAKNEPFLLESTLPHVSQQWQPNSEPLTEAARSAQVSMLDTYKDPPMIDSRSLQDGDTNDRTTTIYFHYDFRLYSKQSALYPTVDAVVATIEDSLWTSMRQELSFQKNSTAFDVVGQTSVQPCTTDDATLNFGSVYDQCHDGTTRVETKLPLGRSTDPSSLESDRRVLQRIALMHIQKFVRAFNADHVQDIRIEFSLINAAVRFTLVGMTHVLSRDEQRIFVQSLQQQIESILAADPQPHYMQFKETRILLQETPTTLEFNEVNSRRSLDKRTTSSEDQIHITAHVRAICANDLVCKDDDFLRLFLLQNLPYQTSLFASNLQGASPDLFLGLHDVFVNRDMFSTSPLALGEVVKDAGGKSLALGPNHALSDRPELNGVSTFGYGSAQEIYNQNTIPNWIWVVLSLDLVFLLSAAFYVALKVRKRAKRLDHTCFDEHKPWDVEKDESVTRGDITQSTACSTNEDIEKYSSSSKSSPPRPEKVKRNSFKEWDRSSSLSKLKARRGDWPDSDSDESSWSSSSSDISDSACDSDSSSSSSSSESSLAGFEDDESLASTIDIPVLVTTGNLEDDPSYRRQRKAPKKSRRSPRRNRDNAGRRSSRSHSRSQVSKSRDRSKDDRSVSRTPTQRNKDEKHKVKKSKSAANSLNDSKECEQPSGSESKASGNVQQDQAKADKECFAGTGAPNPNKKKKSKKKTKESTEASDVESADKQAKKKTKKDKETLKEEPKRRKVKSSSKKTAPTESETECDHPSKDQKTKKKTKKESKKSKDKDSKVGVADAHDQVSKRKKKTKKKKPKESTNIEDESPSDSANVKKTKKSHKSKSKSKDPEFQTEKDHENESSVKRKKTKKDSKSTSTRKKEDRDETKVTKKKKKTKKATSQCDAETDTSKKRKKKKKRQPVTEEG